jgi:hypothetical protein
MPGPCCPGRGGLSNDRRFAFIVAATRAARPTASSANRNTGTWSTRWSTRLRGSGLGMRFVLQTGDAVSKADSDKVERQLPPLIGA